LLLVEQLNRSNSTMGLDTKLHVEVAASFAESAAEVITAGNARAALVADMRREGVSLYAQPLFVLVDGGEATIKRVEVVPVPQYTTLETGAVVVSGYADVEIGFECVVGVREVGADGGLMTYQVKLGELVGYVDNQVPIRTEESLEGKSAIKSGGTYLLGSLERARSSNAKSGALGLLDTRSQDRTELEVWAVVTRVGTAPAVALPTQLSENELRSTGRPGDISDMLESSAAFSGVGMLR
jgi:hypothetical protein